VPGVPVAIMNAKRSLVNYTNLTTLAGRLHEVIVLRLNECVSIIATD